MPVYTQYCQSTDSNASLQTVMPVYTQYCQSTHNTVCLHTIMPVYTQYCLSTHSNASLHTSLLLSLVQSFCSKMCIKVGAHSHILNSMTVCPYVQKNYILKNILKYQQKHFGVAAVILMHSGHRHVSTSQVAIFRVVRT